MVHEGLSSFIREIIVVKKKKVWVGFFSSLETCNFTLIFYSPTPLPLPFLQTDGEYRWSDDWPEIYTNWGAGEPGAGEGCVAMEADGTWNDTLCDRNMPYICKIASGKSVNSWFKI